MNETTAPNAASAETQELLERLRTNYARRVAVLEEIRRGIDRAERDQILLELCAFRGMQYTEAAEALGLVREAVAKRVRPLVTELGLDGLSLIERQKVNVTRPHRRASLETLMAKLQPGAETARDAVRGAAEEARTLRESMLQDMDRLHSAGMSWVELAERMDISVPTLQRLRGTM